VEDIIMKRTIRTALLATTLAMGALTLTTGIAAADTPGPQLDLDISDRQPPQPDPTVPPGPGDLTDETCPTHGGCDPGDPDDRPDDLTDTPPCPTHGPCDPDIPGDEPGDAPGDQPGNGDIPLPTRIDTGAGGPDGGGIELAWLLAGGVLVTVTGAAVAGRAAARSRR
jgi:hypothetical protein